MYNFNILKLVILKSKTYFIRFLDSIYDILENK